MMKLMTKELKAKFPKIGSTETKKADEVKIIANYFDPCGSWTWYATEFDGEDLFFGYVRGFDNELGYFSLSELEAVKGPLGIGIERDMHFGEHTLAEAMDKQI